MARPISQRLLGVRIDTDTANQRHNNRNPPGPRQPTPPPEAARLPVGLDLGQVTGRVQRLLLAELGSEADLNSPQTPRIIENLLNQTLDAQNVPLSRQERA